MTNPLSPAAQAVMDATDYPEDWATRIRVAAAIRALADQAGSAKHWHVNQLHDFADELEGLNDG